MKTKHRDFDIEFDVGSEEWKCGALGLSDKSLAKLKTAVDRAAKKRRQVDVAVLYLEEAYRSRDWTYKIKTATVVLIREGDRKADIKIDGERGNKQVDIGSLYALDQRKKLEAFITAKRKASEADDAASAAKDELSELSAAAIREAVVRDAEDAS